MVIILSSFSSITVVNAQPRFIDSLAQVNQFLKTFHFNFDQKFIYVPEDRYPVIITNYINHVKPYLPLPNPEKPLMIPTDDSSWQCVHPSVIDFLNEHNKAEWNGYRYWMAMTPYPNTNAKKENPNIVASHDGIHWESPKGIKNPIVKIKNDASGENLADPDIIYNPDSNQIWLYYLDRAPTKKNPATINRVIIYHNLKVSKPDTVIFFPKGDSLTLVSPCIWRESANKWHMWGVRIKSPNYICYVFSKDGIHWSDQKICFNERGKNPLHEIGYRPWHISCKPNYRENRIEFMVNCSRGAWETSPPNNTRALMYCETNMATPSNLKTNIYVPLIFCPRDNYSWDYPIIYRASFSIYHESNNYFYKIWYSAESYKTGTWHIGLTEGLIGSYYSNLKIFAVHTIEDDIMIDSRYKSIRINYYGSEDDSIKISLSDRPGHFIFQGIILGKTTDLNIDILPPGNYLATISYKNYHIIRRIIRE